GGTGAKLRGNDGGSAGGAGLDGDPELVHAVLLDLDQIGPGPGENIGPGVLLAAPVLRRADDPAIDEDEGVRRRDAEGHGEPAVDGAVRRLGRGSRRL